MYLNAKKTCFHYFHNLRHSNEKYFLKRTKIVHMVCMPHWMNAIHLLYTLKADWNFGSGHGFWV